MDEISLGGINKLLDHFWTCWDKVAHFLRPYKEDKKRYEYAMSSVQASSVYYFQNVDYSCMKGEPFQQLRNAVYAMSPCTFPAYRNKRLAKKEKRFLDSLINFNETFALKSAPHKRS